MVKTFSAETDCRIGTAHADRVARFRFIVRRDRGAERVACDAERGVVVAAVARNQRVRKGAVAAVGVDGAERSPNVPAALSGTEFFDSTISLGASFTLRMKTVSARSQVLPPWSVLRTRIARVVWAS